LHAEEQECAAAQRGITPVRGRAEGPQVAPRVGQLHAIGDERRTIQLAQTSLHLVDHLLGESLIELLELIGAEHDFGGFVEDE